MTSDSPPKLANLNRLRKGDILLSRPRGIESWFIAKLGGSRFSHAEIVIRDPEESWCVYEATTALTTRKEVVGLIRKKPAADYQYAPIFPPRTASGDEKKRFLERPSEERELVIARDISEYVEFDVLRWRDPPTPEFLKFQDGLGAICERFYLTPYASIDAIARLTAFPWLVKILAKRTRLIPDHIVPGLFCSQLVALVYKNGGFALSSLPAEDITPRHLDELARMPGGHLVAIPRQTLLFSPGSEYELTHDWRDQNTWVNLHGTDTADIIRISERIQRDVEQIANWKPPNKASKSNSRLRLALRSLCSRFSARRR
jgi:hypothetical protein